VQALVAVGNAQLNALYNTTEDGVVICGLTADTAVVLSLLSEAGRCMPCLWEEERWKLPWHRREGRRPTRRDM
jgi:hypothetical protein